MIRFPQFARNSSVLKEFKVEKLNSFEDIVSFVRDPISRAYNKEELEQYLLSIEPMLLKIQLKNDILSPNAERKPLFQHLASRLYDRINK